MTRLLLVAAALVVVLAAAGVAAAAMPPVPYFSQCDSRWGLTNWAAMDQRFAVRAARSHPPRW